MLCVDIISAVQVRQILSGRLSTDGRHTLDLYRYIYISGLLIIHAVLDNALYVSVMLIGS